MNTNFLLVTCCKNEEKYLPTVINSVVSSNIQPIIWLFINDVSTDNSLDIIQDYSKKYNFIKFINIEKGINLSVKNGRLGYLCNLGFNYVIDYCEKNNLDWEYMGLLDADTKINKDHFSVLIEEMNNNSKLGIVSGSVYSIINNTLILEKTQDKLPVGTGRLIRKKCLFDINMYEVTSSPDTVSSIKANLRGWLTKLFTNIAVTQLRTTSSRNGLWKGYILLGEIKYDYNYNKLLIFFNMGNILVSRRIYLIFPFINGYLTSYLSSKPKTPDKEIQYYYKYIKIREILKNRNKILSDYF